MSVPSVPANPTPAAGDFTLLLRSAQEGDERAASALFSLLYAELRRLAAAKMSREAAGHTLQPTALVHEAWLRLGGDRQPAWENRAHFFGAAAEAMRRILIESARRRQAGRHGGGQERRPAEEIDLVPTAEAGDRLIAVHEALARFEAVEPQKASLVKLRYFAGLTLEQAAEAMGVPAGTAKRWWLYSRAWLFREIGN
jgi:RNA polymerase sigma factor (TIGR02999 family)